MDTVKLYEQDAYRKTFSSIVEDSISEKGIFKVALRETAFYPEGGGQPADHGTLGDVKVLDVQERDGIIWHTVSEPLPKGASVDGRIDWERRYDYMQNHSGEHVVSGLICRTFGCSNVGFHMGSDVITMDFNTPMTWEQAMEIEERANRAIEMQIPITASYPTAEELADLDYRSKKELSGRVRILTIEGCDTCACCGTHVRTTAEIRLVKILSLQNYKSGVRITMVSGNRALEDYRRKHDGISAAARMLSAKPEETAQAVERVLEENGRFRYEMAGMRKRIAQLQAQTIPEGTAACFLDEPLAPARELREIANALGERADNVMVMGENGAYVIKSADSRARALQEALRETFTVQGGGSDQMVQGVIRGESVQIEEAFRAAAERVQR